MLKTTQLNQFAATANSINQSPIMVVDKTILKDRATMFKELFPKIEINYALKCFPDAEVVATLDGLVDGYDVASINEIESLLNSGVSPERLSFSNPVKADTAIQAANNHNVRRFAFQSEDELVKIAANAPGSSVYVRLNVHSAAGSLDFSSKFGADPALAISLLQKAAQHGLIPLGVTFHVGSQAQDTTAWKAAIEQAHQIMQNAKELGMVLPELNIGGGYPVEYKTGTLSIVELASVINTELEKIATEFPDTRFIAEPGRFLTADCAVIVSTVIGKEVRGDTPWLYLDTGTFQSFIEVFEFNEFLHPVYSLKHVLNNDMDATTQAYALTGPTCDSYDTMTRAIELPRDIEVGDKLVISMTGAYTLAYGSNFNGFALPSVIFVETSNPDSEFVSVPEASSVTNIGAA